MREYLEIRFLLSYLELTIDEGQSQFATAHICAEDSHKLPLE